MRRRRSLTTIKKNVFDVKNLKDFYQKLKKTINIHDIQETNMWNMNKIGFRIEVKKSKIIILFDKKKKN